jgi:hypothetical protein
MRKHLPITVTTIATIMLCASFYAMAEEKAEDDIDALRAKGYKVRIISPIFSQLVTFSFPKGFKTVFENTNGGRYIREAVLDGETADQWSQMITVTGAKGLAANPSLSAQSFIERITSGFKGACPDTFSSKVVGTTKFSGRDAFIALSACGMMEADGAKYSESALLIGIKGSADYYTIQWAERERASSQPMAFDDAKWTERFKELNPIKICRIVASEAPLYPSCINQK